MNPKIIFTILRKELLETLRDKRTLIAMIGIPILLYPLLIFIMTQVMLVQQGKIEEKNSRIAFAVGTPFQVQDWVKSIDKIEVMEVDDPCMAITSRELDAYVFAEEGFNMNLQENLTAGVTIQYDSTEERSKKAMQRIRDVLRDENTNLLTMRLDDMGLEDEFAKPLNIESDDIAPPQKKTGSLLGRILPMIMVIMLAMGAFYPAVDLTAGEKERGTFETLLSTPTSKLEIVTGKFLTVFCISMLTGLLNLASMMITFTFLLSQMIPQGGNASAEQLGLSMVQITPGGALLIFATLVPMAFFVCSAMMTISLFARNFKEAQNLVTPFYMLIMIPGMVASTPGIELSHATMFIPIINVTLLFKEVLVGQISVEMVFGVLLSTVAFAALALLIASWIFQREDIILSEEKGLPLTLNRKKFKPSMNPTAGMAVLLYCVLLLVMFYGGTYVQGKDVMTGLLITEWVFILLPVVGLLWYTKINLKETLSLRMPRPEAWAGGLLVGVGLTVLAFQILFWLNKVFSMPESFAEQMGRWMTEQSENNFWMLLFAVGISPAICEEIMFRGAILAGVRDKMNVTVSIIAVAVLFGLFHMNIYHLVGPVILGFGLTYVVIRSGSIYVGMMIHAINNSFIVLLEGGKLPASVNNFIETSFTSEGGFPIWFLLMMVVVLIVGIVVMEMSWKMNQLEQSSQEMQEVQGN